MIDKVVFMHVWVVPQGINQDILLGLSIYFTYLLPFYQICFSQIYISSLHLCALPLLLQENLRGQEFEKKKHRFICFVSSQLSCLGTLFLCWCFVYSKTREVDQRTISTFFPRMSIHCESIASFHVSIRKCSFVSVKKIIQINVYSWWWYYFRGPVHKLI